MLPESQSFGLAKEGMDYEKAEKIMWAESDKASIDTQAFWNARLYVDTNFVSHFKDCKNVKNFLLIKQV